MAANITSTLPPIIPLLSRVAHEAHLIRPLLPTYIHLILSALFPIWIAAHASLARPSSAAAPTTKSASSEDDENNEPEEVSQKIESLTPSDAALFPLLAGVTLASLYFILKYLEDPAWLNWGMNIYFSQMGLYFAYGFLADAFATLRGALFPRYYSWAGVRWVADTKGQRYVREGSDAAGAQVAHTSPFPGALRLVPLPAILERFVWRVREAVSAKATLTLHIRGTFTLRTTPTLMDAIALVLAIVLTYTHAFIAKPWQLTNFLGLSFCYGSLQMTSPSTAWTATLLLSALLVYDIYFVFFTPIMVHVATNLDVPIKMVFPRPDGCVMPVGADEGSAEMEEYLKCLGKKRAMAMLGLGDIVVPGLVMAFALRWDLWLYYFKLQKEPAVVKAPGDQSRADSPKIDKEPYRAATGGWGERFWTASALQPAALKAKGFRKPYFKATVIGYVLGLCVTVGVMQVAKHAQPALLYLVPGVLGALWGTALVKGEAKLLWNYVEEDDSEKSKDKDKEENKAPKKSGEQDGPEPHTQEGAVDQTEDATVDKENASDEKANDTSKTTSPESKEMVRICKHAIYFAIKLPTPSTTTRKETQVEPSTDATTPSQPKSPAPAAKSTKSKANTKSHATTVITTEAEVPDSTGDEADDTSESEVDSRPETTAMASNSAVATRRRTRNQANKLRPNPFASRRQTRASSGRALRSSGSVSESTDADGDEDDQADDDQVKRRMAKRRRRG